MNVNVEAGGKLIANGGILIGHGTDGNHPDWVNLNGGEIVTTSIQGQNNNNNTGADMLTAFTMTDGTLTITGENAFGLTAVAKKLKVVLQGGTVAAEASQMNLSGNPGNENLVFTIGNVIFNTGDNHVINLNHDFTQTGTLSVTGNGYAGNQRYLIAKGDTDGPPLLFPRQLLRRHRCRRKRDGTTPARRRRHLSPDGRQRLHLLHQHR